MTTVSKAAIAGVFTILALTLAAGPASAQGITLNAHGLRGSFEIGPDTTRTIVDLTKTGLYRLCAGRGNAGPLTLHLDADRTATLNAGECRTYRSARIAVENPAARGVAVGYYKRRALL